MKSKLLALTTATLIAMGSGLAVPAFAAGPDVDIHTKDPDVDANAAARANVDTRDLEAKLEDARARLEQAAHEVAELSSQMGGPLMNKFYVFNDDGPPKAVIGVQLDAESGKDGARVQEVSPGGPADEAGLHVGDIITQINGTDVKGEQTARQVMEQMRKVTPESKIKVRVLRDGKPRDFVVAARKGATFLGMRQRFDGTKQSFDVPVPPFPPFPPGVPEVGVSTFGPVLVHGALGQMELATLTPQLGRYFGTDKGVLVVRAPKDFKLEDGDVILAIDGREPTSGSHATRILSSYQPGEKISIKVMRQQKTLNVETTLPEHSLPEPEHDGKTRKMMPHTGGGAT